MKYDKKKMTRVMDKSSCYIIKLFTQPFFFFKYTHQLPTIYNLESATVDNHFIIVSNNAHLRIGMGGFTFFKQVLWFHVGMQKLNKTQEIKIPERYFQNTATFYLRKTWKTSRKCLSLIIILKDM